MPNTFEAKMRPFMSVMKNKLLSDHFFFQAVVFVISEYTLLIYQHGIAFAGNMLSLLNVKISYFVNSRDPYSYKCSVI